ncbi:MAG: extracellular matrix/biofilm biosynthesis regulator RemA family protein [Vulcanimicrobiota bacterium]
MVLGIGYGNFVSMDKIVAVVSPDSAPIKRLIRESKKDKKLIDATAGHRTRSVLIMDNGHIILSANQPETVVQRCNKKDKEIA